MGVNKKGMVRREDVLQGQGTRHPEWHFTSFYAWLKQEGFFCKNDTFFQVIDKIAHPCSVRDISLYVENNLFYERNKQGKVVKYFSDHLEMFNRNRGRYISEKNLMMSLGEMTKRELRDDKFHAYFPFLNGIVVVDQNFIELLPYEKVLVNDNVIVFEDKIIKHNVEVKTREQAMTSDFADFCKKAIDGEDSGTRGYTYLMRAIGYMLHGYKDPATAKMVFFSDCNNAHGISEGRTGKSLIAQVALRQMRNLAVVDGKQFDYKDKFMLDNVDESTDIVCMQDMRKNFNQETLYNLITGDFQIGKKYKSKEVIPFEVAPKIIADSNFSIRLTGGSDFARIITIGFGHFFNYRNTPADYYGKRFFDDWNDTEYDKFYSFMFQCVSDYLNKGVKSYKFQELMAFSIYNRFPLELCGEIAEILKDKDNFFLQPSPTYKWWDQIGYFNSVATDMSNIAKLRMVTDIMREFGYTKFTQVKTIHATVEEERHGKKDTKIQLHWFKKISSLGVEKAINFTPTE